MFGVGLKRSSRSAKFFTLYESQIRQLCYYSFILFLSSKQSYLLIDFLQSFVTVTVYKEMFSFLTNSPQWWTTSIEQYVLQILEFFRSVLARNSAISSSATRGRHICFVFLFYFYFLKFTRE